MPSLYTSPTSSMGCKGVLRWEGLCVGDDLSHWKPTILLAHRKRINDEIIAFFDSKTYKVVVIEIEEDRFPFIYESPKISDNSDREDKYGISDSSNQNGMVEEPEDKETPFDNDEKFVNDGFLAINAAQTTDNVFSEDMGVKKSCNSPKLANKASSMNVEVDPYNDEHSSGDICNRVPPYGSNSHCSLFGSHYIAFPSLVSFGLFPSTT
ncbi:hypothetical protein L1887_34447 [Cichorium endivia]|nr:hypothetical protein L1887_34447 [Cichorium endivia]